MLVHNVIMSWLFLTAFGKTTEALSPYSTPPPTPPPPPDYVSPSAPKPSYLLPPPFHHPDLLAPNALKAHSGATKPTCVLSTVAGPSTRIPSTQWVEQCEVGMEGGSKGGVMVGEEGIAIVLFFSPNNM